jgi:hypothetical protein
MTELSPCSNSGACLLCQVSPGYETAQDVVVPNPARYAPTRYVERSYFDFDNRLRRPTEAFVLKSVTTFARPRLAR